MHNLKIQLPIRTRFLWTSTRQTATCLTLTQLACRANRKVAQEESFMTMKWLPWKWSKWCSLTNKCRLNPNFLHQITLLHQMLSNSRIMVILILVTNLAVQAVLGTTIITNYRVLRVVSKEISNPTTITSSSLTSITKVILAECKIMAMNLDLMSGTHSSSRTVIPMVDLPRSSTKMRARTWMMTTMRKCLKVIHLAISKSHNFPITFLLVTAQM